MKPGKSRTFLYIPIRLLARAVLSVILICSSFAYSDNGLTYHGRIVRPDGLPVTATNVSFTIQIRSPGTESCLLYQETHILNMAGSDGVFKLEVGTGTRVSSSVDGGLSLSTIFSNKSVAMSPLPSCQFGSSYTPNTMDTRKLIVSFNDGTGVQTLDAQNISYVPFAIEAHQISGFNIDHLLRIDGGVAPALSPADYSKLRNLIDGTSGDYVQTSSSLSRIDFGPELSVNGTAGGSLTTTGTVTLTPTGVTAGTYGSASGIAQIQVDANGRVVSASEVPLSAVPSFSGSLSGDVSGTQTTTSVDKIKGQNVSASTPLEGQILKYTSGVWTPFRLNVSDLKSSVGPAYANQFPGNCLASETLSYQSASDKFVCSPISVSSFTGSLAGDVTGSQSATQVSSVGGVSASNVAAGANAANAATSSNVGNAIVLRDSNGDFTAGTITANLSGHATSATSFIGNLLGDVTGTQGATVVSFVGGVSAADVAAGATAANAATSANVANTLVLRDASGGFAAGNVSATSVTSSGDIKTAGRMIAAASSTTNAKVEVDGQILSRVFNAGAGLSIDWNNGNVQYTSASCGSFIFSNLYEGGTYTLIVTGGASGTCSFSQSSPDTLSSGDFLFAPTNTATIAGKSTVFTLMRAGNKVYVSWITGF